MKKYNYLISFLAIFFFLASCNSADSNKETTNNTVSDSYSFKIDQPQGWVNMIDLDVKENLKLIDSFSNEEIEELVSQSSGQPIVVYMKHDPNSYAGLIPTIKVTLMHSLSSNFDEFKNSIKGSIPQMEQLLDNFNIIIPLTELDIDGQKGVYFTSEFTIEYGGKIEKIRSWTYAVSVDKYLYQINFSDMNGDDCSKVYEDVLKSIKL